MMAKIERRSGLEYKGAVWDHSVMRVYKILSLGFFLALAPPYTLAAFYSWSAHADTVRPEDTRTAVKRDVFQFFGLKDCGSFPKLVLDSSNETDGLPAYATGLVYEFGICMPVNKGMALQAYDQARSISNPAAALRMGIITEGLDADQRRAFRSPRSYFREAAVKLVVLEPSDRETTILALMLPGETIPRLFQEQLIEAIEINDGTAEQLFAASLEVLSGQDIPKNEMIGRHWMMRSMAKGHVEASYMIGTWYLDGIHGPTSPRSGLIYLWDAASKGYGAAARDLGLRYLNGKAVGKDLKKAYIWLSRAEVYGQDISVNLMILREKLLEMDDMTVEDHHHIQLMIENHDTVVPF
ncbi:tetratricopeptide repeat protein [Magnetospira sp. QH-2]|uniref:tetratricopeptide repeat protein n=1 Tax=Magnetospira sp. (strain QH-2) TaxID=1288970 RepID=UPI00130D7C8A|nr:SEL1-like repeat protein [Magnetospira sp. QH-2]